MGSQKKGLKSRPNYDDLVGKTVGGGDRKSSFSPQCDVSRDGGGHRGERRQNAGFTAHNN